LNAWDNDLAKALAHAAARKTWRDDVSHPAKHRKRSTPENPMLNDMLEALRDIAGDDDTDFMLDLLESYQSTTPDLLAVIKAAHSKEEVVALGNAAHQLKSSSAMIGCMGFADQCAALEKVCKTGDTDPSKLAALAMVIQQAYPAVQTTLNAALRQLSRTQDTPPSWKGAQKALW